MFSNACALHRSYTLKRGTSDRMIGSRAERLDSTRLVDTILMVAMKETYSNSQFPVRLLIYAIYSKTKNRESPRRAADTSCISLLSKERRKNNSVFVLACYLLNHHNFVKGWPIVSVNYDWLPTFLLMKSLDGADHIFTFLPHSVATISFSTLFVSQKIKSKCKIEGGRKRKIFASGWASY